MVLETVSPELPSCVQTALGDEQYNAIISGHQDAVAEQLGLVLPCILQYPQEANAIMEMFGLDMGTIMAASTPIPNTQAPIPTNTPAPQPTNTPTSVPNPTSVPTPTPRPLPTAVPTPTLGPTPTRIPPTPTPLPTPLPAHFFKGCSYGPNHENAPDVFIGEVSNVDWSATGDGTSVSAWIGSTEMANTQVSGGAEYVLRVPACMDSREINYYKGGAIIKFSIDGFWAEQTFEGFGYGGGYVLNLHQTNDPVVIN